MPHTSRERYAVASCHVERPLDAAVWARFAALQEARPGGFVIAALMRPPDPAFGENQEAVWLARAREAESRAPLGHHTHWTAPDHARPRSLVTDRYKDARTAPSGGETGLVTDRYKGARSVAGSDTADLVTDRYKAPGERVAAEGEWLREQGLSATVFCGGGWYTDADVAVTCAELGYVDCTPRATRPGYLGPGEPWALLTSPSVVELPSGRELLAIPTTHSLGDLLRALPRRDLPDVLHVYFHDTDLLSARRRALLRAGLAVLAKRARVTDLDALAAWGLADLPRVPWDDVARL